jgi:hypothetical protein
VAHVFARGYYIFSASGDTISALSLSEAVAFRLVSLVTFALSGYNSRILLTIRMD